MDAGEVLDVLGDDHAFLGGRDRDDLGVGTRIHAAIAYVHGVVAAIIEEVTGFVRDHLVDEEPHGL